MNKRLIRAGVSTNAPKEVVEEFLREYLPDGKREGVVFETRPWQYVLYQLHED